MEDKDRKKEGRKGDFCRWGPCVRASGPPLDLPELWGRPLTLTRLNGGPQLNWGGFAP